MRRIVGLVLSLVMSLVWLSGCKEKTDSYCCTGPSCSPRVTCGDLARPYCDDQGAYGDHVPRTCIADPMAADGGGACEMTSDCKDPGTPLCIGNVCVQCQGPADCSAQAPVCQAVHSCGACEAESDCNLYAPGTPHCGALGHCVACRTAFPDDCDLGSPAPVCDPGSAACRPCQGDDECSSGICDEGSGACVQTPDIIHVDGTATGGLGCGTAASPCRTINEGVLAVQLPNRFWIQVAAGTYQENLVLDGKKVRIVGPFFLPPASPKVTLTPAANQVACALITGNSDVSLENMELSGAGGITANADGVRCNIGGATASPRLTLKKVTVDLNAAQGVDSSSCDLTIEGSIIRGNPLGGLFAVDSKVSMTRTAVVSNSGGGVSLSASDFSLVNNFIIDNGSSSSTIGGVLISMDPPSGVAGARFEFNTVAGNNTKDGFASGIRCDVGTTLSFKNSIVYNNQPDPSATIGQVSGDSCKWTFSDIGPNGPAVTGNGNINLNPTFLNPASDNFHIDTASLAKNVAETSSQVGEDFDGEPRPMLGGWDMGADEVQP